MNKIFREKEYRMAFRYTVGTDWCHNFPKLAKESGFHFNMYRSHVRVDWNQISAIDIDRVIRERDFLTIDDNIHNVMDYHLETEYDVRILDSNFVKLFRLAQLSVEYLLYCKQYLDHSVLILKDELRLKLEENVQLKKELLTFKDNIKEFHKCPFCPKTFMTNKFMDAHISRRHSDLARLSLSSPMHEPYKLQAAKLQNEIKELKQRLNETDQIITSESLRIRDKIASNKIEHDDLKNGELETIVNVKDRTLEEERKNYRDEINHSSTMLFSEIRSLKQDENESVNHDDSDTGNMRASLKRQEIEIDQMRDQLQRLSSFKSMPDMKIIQAKLNAQTNFWQMKLEQLESQRRDDIETLLRQLQVTQTSVNYVKADHSIKLSEFEESPIIGTELPDSLRLLIRKSKRIPDLIGRSNRAAIEMNNRRISGQNTISFGPDVNACDQIFDADTLPTDSSVHVSQRLTIDTINSDNDPAKICGKKSSTYKNTQSSTLQRRSIEKSLNQQNERENEHPHVGSKFAPGEERLLPDTNIIIYTENVSNAEYPNSTNISSCKLHESILKSECTSIPETTISTHMRKSHDTNHTISCERIKTQESEQFENGERPKSKEKLKKEIQQALDQRLRNLGVDPEWQYIPSATYRQLIDIMKYHRSIDSKKHREFENLREAIEKQMTDKVLKHNEDNERLSTFDAVNETKTDNTIINMEPKCFTTSGIQGYHGSRITKLQPQISLSDDKSITNKIETVISPRRISQLELHKVTSPVIRLAQGPKLISNRDTETMLSTPIDDRYAPSHDELVMKTMEYMDKNHSFQSCESIKDCITNNYCNPPRAVTPLGISGSIITSTPQRNHVNISRSHETVNSEVPHHPPNSTGLMDPSSSKKYNKSVLKLPSESTGNFVKKKVLFDLQTNKNAYDSTKSHDLYRVPMIGNVSENDDNSIISEIFEEESHKVGISLPSGRDNIVLRTSQCEKIAEISRKIESRLNAIRHKPLQGIEAMFMEGFRNKTEYPVT